MARENTWLNNDGLKVPFGTSDGLQSEGASIHTKGMDKELRLDLDVSNLPVSGTAVEGDNVGIPADAVILSAEFEGDVAFDQAIEFGTMDQAGVTVDKDGLIGTSAPGANSFTVGAGAQLLTVAAEALYVTVEETLTPPTTGSGTLVIKYRI